MHRCKLGSWCQAFISDRNVFKESGFIGGKFGVIVSNALISDRMC